jgi:hypothetical protein
MQIEQSLYSDSDDYDMPSLDNYTSSTISILGDLDGGKAHKQPPAKTSDDLIDVFYKCYYPAHPFVLPRKAILQHPRVIPDHLRAVMRFTASHYRPDAVLKQEALQDAAYSSLWSLSTAEDGFKVQSLMLFAMTLFGRFEQPRGAEMLDLAIDLALKLGLNSESCIIQEASGDPLLAESFRRTWWDIFILDGIVSTLNGSSHVFRLQMVASDVCIPGNCEAYNQGLLRSHGRTLQELQNRTISEDEFAWSSFAYQIEAMCIMSSILQLDPDTFAAEDPQIESLDISISNYVLSLPNGKRDIVPDADGRIDEVLFGAHTLIHWASITLHRPGSNLTFIQNHYRTACTRSPAIRMPTLAYSSHTAKALRAANAISNLTAIQTPMALHTSCFACAIALACTIHLPAYMLQERPRDADTIKQRLQLSISALGTIAEVWPLARVVKSQVAQFARETFVSAPAPAPSNTPNTTTAAQSKIAPPPPPRAQVPQIDFDSLLSNDSWLDELCRSGAMAGDMQAIHAMTSRPGDNGTGGSAIGQFISND